MHNSVQRLSKVGTGLRGIGTSMFTGTRELLEHVTEAISSELDSIEGIAARNKPQHSRSGSRCAPAHPLCWSLLAPALESHDVVR